MEAASPVKSMYEYACEFCALADRFRAAYGVPEAPRAAATFAEAAEQAGLRSKMFYTVDEVARVIGVETSTIYEEIATGRMRYHLPEGRRNGKLIKPEWVDAWIREGSR